VDCCLPPPMRRQHHTRRSRGHRVRSPAPRSHPDFDRVRVGFFFYIFDELHIFPEFSEQIERK